ncbi:O-antigen ligase family protein [Clostridium uliginosum]|uniref:O-antigen ligase n=1 Tax=Clostridium uliginosum TaxID=119641 RepID=A0A1I1K0S3_9CLOT|nr:O-antigen ligase family protein [Clostridium uliginosum]SFC54091.1 O-antigen ligase [Clostridium uliginosum]
MKEIFKNIYNFINNRLYFRLLYLFVSISFVTILSNIPGIKIGIKTLNSIALVWGMLLILFMIFNEYKTRKIYKFDIPLAGFIIITLIFNLTVYRNIDNIKVWIFNLILLTSIFTIDVFKNKKTNIKEINIITYFYTIFMFPLSIISLYMRFSGKTIEIGEIIFGSTNGLFINENALAIAASLAIAMSVYLNLRAKSGKVKMLLVLNIVIQTITMIEAKGRSSYLIIIAIIFLFLFVYYKNKYFRFALILIPIIAGSICFTFNEDRLHKFTSGRNILWTSGSMVIQQHPLTGVGSSDLIEAVTDVKEVEYLPGIEGGGLHNIYVQIATTNGVIALGLIITFLLSIMVFIIKQLDKLKRKEKIQMTTITSMLVGIIAVNLFESNLVYIVSFISIIFWTYLGYLISILDNKNIS